MMNLRKSGKIYGLECGLDHFPDFGLFAFRCQSSPKNLDYIERMYFDWLDGINPDQIVEVHKSAQRKREMMFIEPLEAYESAISELAVSNKIYTQSQQEGIEDNVTFDKVSDINNRLQKTKPFVLKIISE